MHLSPETRRTETQERWDSHVPLAFKVAESFTTWRPFSLNAWKRERRDQERGMICGERKVAHPKTCGPGWSLSIPPNYALWFIGNHPGWDTQLFLFLSCCHFQEKKVSDHNYEVDPP